MKNPTLLLILITLICVEHYAQGGSTVKIVTYNLLNYPDNYSVRNSDFQKILDEISPEILVVQEILSQFAVNTFRSGVLGSEYTSGSFINGPDTDNAIFYKDSLFTLIANRNIPTTLRDISEYTLVHNFSSDTLIIYTVHLKASDGQTNEQQRLAEVTVLRNVTDNLSAGTNFIVAGDFNIYYSGEPAYQKLINQSATGYFIDPLPAGYWHSNDTYAEIHTQSTCNSSSCPNGGAGGGLDDRFDMILISQAIFDSVDIYLIENSSKAFGNDGLHFNKAINVPPFSVITQEIANALYNASDHLPVIAEFQFGAVNSVEPINPSEISFVLYQNYPNPFNPSTTIKFEVPNVTSAKVVLYDLLGRKIKVLFDGYAQVGSTELKLSAEDLQSGIYFYTLIAGEFVSSKKLIVLK